MKKPVVFLGLIILSFGLYLISYRMQIEIRLSPTPDATWKWIPKEKVDEYKKLGWRECTSRYLLREAMKAKHDPSDVLMWKEKEILEIYPYQTIGAIISLIGSVTAIIGHYIPEQLIDFK
ncbi:MAG: hypothetical protein DRG31_07285 [Deltaproteobacteria bacterium]|nr:MAG: hypothetical protein DRG31_07285 [Deltaproteobacteria bacterium]